MPKSPSPEQFEARGFAAAFLRDNAPELASERLEILIAMAYLMGQKKGLQHAFPFVTDDE